MSKVLLISPPYLDLYGELNKAAGRYFPLGLGYIASYLRKDGNHDVMVLEPEAQGLSHTDLGRIIREQAPDIIGLTCSTPNFFHAVELARIGKQYSKAKIVLGGVHASALPEFIILNYGDLFDCIVVGEGEVTMLELADAYQNSRDIATVKGLVCSKDGETVHTGQRVFIEDLDAIPFPARDLIPQKLFYPNMHNGRYRNCLSILTSRGCPFNCSFCASRIVSGKLYRMHSAEYVLSEMEMLKKDYGARQLIITDDTFTINHDRLEEICRGMINRRLNLAWFCFSQVNVVNKEILTLMKKAGCYNIGFGVESADEEILKRMGKPIKPERAIRAVKEAREAGMKTQTFYIFGSPGETRKKMEETVRLAKKIGSTLAFFNMLVPFPGTREFDHYFSSVPLEKIDWKNFVAIGESCVLRNGAVAPAEIERLLARANFEYFAHPLRFFRVLWHIRTFYELTNYLRGGVGLLRQIMRWLRREK